MGVQCIAWWLSLITPYFVLHIWNIAVLAFSMTLLFVCDLAPGFSVLMVLWGHASSQSVSRYVLIFVLVTKLAAGKVVQGEQAAPCSHRTAHAVLMGCKELCSSAGGATQCGLSSFWTVPSHQEFRVAWDWVTHHWKINDIPGSCQLPLHSPGLSLPGLCVRLWAFIFCSVPEI